MGRQDAQRLARRDRLGHRAKNRRPKEGLHHGWQLRRLRHASWIDIYAREVRVWCRYSRSLEHLTLLNTIPPYWASGLQMFKDRVGDHTTDEGKKFLNERSPLTYHEKITKPLLIAQGANDPRVKQSEADQIVKAWSIKRFRSAMSCSRRGHGFARPNNSLAFNAVTEAFLAVALGRPL